MPSPTPIDLVGFAWSPLLEAVLSLRAVVVPKRAPMHLPWVRRCRELPEGLTTEIRALSPAYTDFVAGVFEVGLSNHTPTFEDEIAAFRALDDDVFAYEISLGLGGLGCGPVDGRGPHLVNEAAYRDDVLRAIDVDDHVALAHAVFDDPAGVRERYAAMLEWYWQAAFRDEWERVLPRIELEATDGARALVTRGVPGLVSTLLPEGRWDDVASTIIVDKEWDATCDVADRGGLLFVPTVYGWPCVLIELAPPWPVSIMFPLRDLRQPEVPSTSDHEVADGLRALGDETRLQIARLVAEQPRSTKELAELLQLSDSAVSRHLKTLHAAGVVRGRRDGYFVLYGLVPERIAQLGGALRHTLGLTQGHSADVPALPVSLSRVPAGR